MSQHWITRRNFLCSAAAAALPMTAQQAQSIESQFRDVPNGYRLRMHWYVFGPAWTAEEGERELKLMANAHVGGVLLFPTYPIAVDNPARGIENQRYLSPAYLETLRAITGACKRAGLTFDMVLGTGWPYGGPSVSLDQSAHALRMSQVAPARITRRRTVDCGPRSARTGILFGTHSHGGETGRVGRRRPGCRSLQSGCGTPIPPGCRRQVARARFPREKFARSSATASKCTGPPGRPGSRKSLRGRAVTICYRNCPPCSIQMTRAVATFAAISGAPSPNRPKNGFVKPLGEWAHANGVTTQVEAYGTPPNSIRAYRLRRYSYRRTLRVEGVQFLPLGEFRRPPGRKTRNPGGGVDLAWSSQPICRHAGTTQAVLGSAFSERNQCALWRDLRLLARESRLPRLGALLRPGHRTTLLRIGPTSHTLPIT